MEAGSKLLVIPTLHHKCVGFPPDHIDFWNEQAIDVPGNAPAHMASDGRVSIVTTSGTNLGKEDPILGFIALYRRDEPWLITSGDRRRCRGPLIPVLGLFLWGRLASNWAVPLRDPSKVKVKIPKQSFLVIRNFSLEF